MMKFNFKLFLSLFVFSLIQYANAEVALFSVSSKEQGAVFDITVKEIKRDDVKSFLLIPEFHTKTKFSARWLRCVYTDLAIKRGFKFWSAMHPESGQDDIVIVAFSNVKNDTPKILFGAEYDPKRVLNDSLSSTEDLAKFCGMLP